jgi:hypothetical protein
VSHIIAHYLPSLLRYPFYWLLFAPCTRICDTMMVWLWRFIGLVVKPCSATRANSILRWGIGGWPFMHDPNVIQFNIATRALSRYPCRNLYLVMVWMTHYCKLWWFAFVTTQCCTILWWFVALVKVCDGWFCTLEVVLWWFAQSICTLVSLWWLVTLPFWMGPTCAHYLTTLFVNLSMKINNSFFHNKLYNNNGLEVD